MSGDPASSVPRLLPSVFVVGDSISLHYGPYLEECLQGRFVYDRKRSPPGSSDPDAANGGDSARVLAYLRERLTGAGIPRGYLLLNCGLHDIKTDPAAGSRQVPPERYEENLRAVLALAREHALEAIWVRTTPVVDDLHNARNAGFRRHAADVARYNSIADEVMARQAVPVVDLHAFTLPFIPAGYIDHVHFSVEVRRLQGSYLAGFLHGLHARASRLPR